jgi:hypothetical protein
VDFAVPRYRQMIFERANRVALSSGAHTLAAYRRLPEGWLVTPPGEFVDAWMWRRFAEQPDTVFACSTRPTVMHLPSKLREGWTPEERLAELADCAGMLEDPARRIDYLAALVASEHERLLFLETQATELEAWVADRQRALDSVLAQKQELADEVAMMRGSRRWRVGEQVKRELRRFSRP